MTADEALKEIRGLAGANRIKLTRHAVERMSERAATYEDIRHAIVTARRCVWQADKQNWKVKSSDLDGDDLTIAVDVQDAVVVVTLF